MTTNNQSDAQKRLEWIESFLVVPSLNILTRKRLEAEKKGILLGLESAKEDLKKLIDYQWHNPKGQSLRNLCLEYLGLIKIERDFFPEDLPQSHPVSANWLKTKEEEYRKCSPLPTQERRDSTHNYSQRDSLKSMANDTLPDSVERHASTPSVLKQQTNESNFSAEVKGQVETLLTKKELIDILFSINTEGDAILKTNRLCTSRHNEIVTKIKKDEFELGESYGTHNERERVLGLIDDDIELTEEIIKAYVIQNTSHHQYHLKKMKELRNQITAEKEEKQ